PSVLTRIATMVAGSSAPFSIRAVIFDTSAGPDMAMRNVSVRYGMECSSIGRRGEPSTPAKKERGPRGPRFRRQSACSSALGELERAPRLRLAVLLALDDAGVAGQEAAVLEHAAQFRLEVGERLGEPVAHRAGLAGQPATGHAADDVVLSAAVRDG